MDDDLRAQGNWPHVNCKSYLKSAGLHEFDFRQRQILQFTCGLGQNPPQGSTTTWGQLLFPDDFTRPLFTRSPKKLPIHSQTSSQRLLFGGGLVTGKESRFLDLISLLCRYNWSKTPLKLEKRPRLLVDSGQVPPLVSGLFTFFSFRDRYHMTMTYQGVRLLEWVEIHTGLPSPFTHNSYNHDYYESNPWLTCLFHTITIISLLAFYLTLLTYILIILTSK